MPETDPTDPLVHLALVIADDRFPALDVALRAGRHVDRDDADWYALLSEGQEVLEALYARYGCTLVQASDGYFYLLPSNDEVSRRQLSVAEMLVGQCLALSYLDPATMQSGGVVAQGDVLGQLAQMMGSDALVAALTPPKRRRDERVAEELVRRKVAQALRRLASMGFVELLEGERLRLRSPLMRFAASVRGEGAPEERLRALATQGEVVLRDESTDGEPDDDAEDPDGGEPDTEAP